MITLPRNPLTGGDRRDPAGRSRRRFARRQWLRRWLVWRYVIGSVLLVVLAVTGVWLVFFSSTLTVKHVDVQGESLLSQQQILDAAERPGRRPPGPARPRRPSAPASPGSRRSSASTSRASGPTAS